MRTVINKIGNLEIEDNVLKFRMPINEFNTDDIITIEKNIKRKMTSIEADPFYLKPFEIQIINSSVVLYYQMEHYAGFTYLRQLDFKDKLKYYTSLIEIAKRQKTTKVLWDKFNFFVDPIEENIKTVIFETENMKVLENIDAFNGLKELILISLTNLDRILGKPSRVDFIEQEEDIIQFAETLLKIEDLDDLDHFVSTKRIEYEHGLIETTGQQKEEASVNKKKVSLSFLKVNNKSNKPGKQYKKTVTNNASKKKNTSNKKLYILLGVLAFAILFNFVYNSDKTKGKKQVIAKASEQYPGTSVTREKGEETKVAATTDKKYNGQILEAYRAKLTGNSKKAIEILESIGFKNLSENDRNILLNIYEDSGQINKVIDLKPERAKELVNTLVARDETGKLIGIQKAMQTKNPYVDFEVAYLKEDWKKIIDLKDLIELNGKREEQIVKAYINLQQFTEGKKFAETVGNPTLLEEVETYKATN